MKAGSGSRAAAAKNGAAGTAAGGKAGAAAGSRGEQGGETGKPQRKGITIVSKKPARKPKAPKPVLNLPPPSEQLLGPNSKYRQPLIQPSEPSREGNGADGGGRGKKPALTKKDLEMFRSRLVQKRAELLGSMSTHEDEALSGGSGDLAHSSQHPADEGSESYDRALSLNLAAADRRLIKEIDDAIQRIDEGTYGICEASGRPIRKARLQELPWARLSIEAARELERGRS